MCEIHEKFFLRKFPCCTAVYPTTIRLPYYIYYSGETFELLIITDTIMYWPIWPKNYSIWYLLVYFSGVTFYVEFYHGSRTVYDNQIQFEIYCTILWSYTSVHSWIKEQPKVMKLNTAGLVILFNTHQLSVVKVKAPLIQGYKIAR